MVLPKIQKNVYTGTNQDFMKILTSQNYLRNIFPFSENHIL